MVAASPARILRDFAADDPALSTLDRFEALGIAVFPQHLRDKGTWVEGWPTMSIREASLVTRDEVSRGLINLAGRTGNGVAVIDLDGANDIDPAEMLPLLLTRVEPAVIAIVKTSRGYHIWVAITKSVGNGYCSAVGGEIFSGPHLAMLPPVTAVTALFLRPYQPRASGVARPRAAGLARVHGRSIINARFSNEVRESWERSLQKRTRLERQKNWLASNFRETEEAQEVRPAELADSDPEQPPLGSQARVTTINNSKSNSYRQADPDNGPASDADPDAQDGTTRTTTINNSKSNNL